MAWIEMFVRAPEAIDNPQGIKRIDDELMSADRACFYCPPPSGMPVREADGTWGLRVRHEVDLDWAKSILAKYKLEIVREDRYEY